MSKERDTKEYRVDDESTKPHILISEEQLASLIDKVSPKAHYDYYERRPEIEAERKAKQTINSAKKYGLGWLVMPFIKYTKALPYKKFVGFITDKAFDLTILCIAAPVALTFVLAKMQETDAGMIKSGDPSFSVHSGSYNEKSGMKPYGELGNVISLILRDGDIHPYGQTYQTAATQNVYLVAEDGQEMSVGLSQPDAKKYIFKEEGDDFADKVKVIKKLDMFECAHTVSRSINNYEQIMDKVAQGQTVTIGLLSDKSGAHITGINIIESLLGDDIKQVKFTEFRAQVDLVDAASKGTIDIGIFTEIPATFNNYGWLPSSWSWVPNLLRSDMAGTLSYVRDNDMKLVNMSTNTFADNIANDDYNLYNIEYPFNVNEKTGNNISSLCMDSVEIVGRNPDSIVSKAFRNVVKDKQMLLQNSNIVKDSGYKPFPMTKYRLN